MDLVNDYLSLSSRHMLVQSACDYLPSYVPIYLTWLARGAYKVSLLSSLIDSLSLPLPLPLIIHTTSSPFIHI